jgi:murein DD-endopeptidase MepM/ murein hydrolase activator NlpD
MVVDPPRLVRRVALGALLVCVVATPALGDDILEQKIDVDARIQALSSQLAQQRRDEAALRSQIEAYTERIRALEASVGDVSLQLSTLERDLALHRERLAKLTKLFKLQSARLEVLKRQHALAVDRLDRRLVSIYMSPRPTMLEYLFGATSIEDVIDTAHYLSLIGQEDKRIAAEVARSKLAMEQARTHTAKLRKTVRSAERVLSARAAQVRETRDALLGARDSLAASKQGKLVALSELSAQERAQAQEMDALLAQSSQLAAQIRAAQAANAASGDTTPSASGLVWPVSGPVTSPFGWRWGRMHEGIDIGVGYGAPISAAAAGTVIYCGWAGGYGNLVVIDHGGGLATAYAHQSSIAVSCGQQVSQGQVVGYIGCTGHCYGPHLHFEVRINGSPVDPLGYL